MKKTLSIVLALAMVFAMMVPAFAADGDPAWSVDFDKNAKAVVITVDGETQKFTNWKNNQAEEFTVNGWIVSVTVKGNAINKKALIGPVAAPVEPAVADAVESSTASNSQVVVDEQTRIWHDGFGFHCNHSGGNGATSVINLRGGNTVAKGDQKNVFGTKSFPITLVRVGNTTLWNLQTEDIECETCGSTEWVTYSNNSGVINGKNIQAHHPAYVQITKVWTDDNPNDLDAIFDIYKYDSNKDDGKGELVAEGALPNVKYQLEPGTYVVSERVKDGYKVQDDQRLTVEEGKTTVFSFKNEPNEIEKYGALSIQKTVGGQSFSDWAFENGLSPAEVDEIILGMSFTAYRLSGENGIRTGASYDGSMGVNGVIEFGDDLPIGWYEVEEVISGTAVAFFVGEGKTNVYFVGEIGVNAEDTSWVSGKKDVGTVVTHDGVGVNWELPKVWNDRLANEPYFQDLLDMGAQWIWDVENTYQYGFTGDVVRFDYSVGLAEDLTAPIIFAADNAAIIYVNGELAAYTTVAFDGRVIPQTITDEDADTFFDSLDYETFDGRWNEGWAHVYKEDITLTAGENTITIFAANSESTHPVYTGTPASGTDNDAYDLTNNPCGLIFGFDIPGATFDNESLLEKYADVSFNKAADGEGVDLTQFAFELFRFDEATGAYDVRIPYENPAVGDGYYYAGLDGVVIAGGLEVGKYVFKEVGAGVVWAPRGYEDGLFFEITREGAALVTTWTVADGEGVDAEGEPVVVNEKVLGSLEVTAAVTASHDEVSYEPVLEDVTIKNETNTLVSKSNHNLGTLNGHQVFVAVDIAAARTGDGVMVEVADSSPNNNGIGYFYNVKIEDGQIVVTFPDVKSADVGIMAANDKSGLTNGHPNGKKGTAQAILVPDSNSLSVVLPANCGEYVYLFMHIAGGLEWYTGEKIVVGYKETGRETITDIYTGTLTATLTDADDVEVDSKVIANNGSVTFENLLPGEYTCTFSGEGFEAVSKPVTIEAGAETTVSFEAHVTNPDKEIGKTTEIGTIISAPAAGAAAPIAAMIEFDLEEFFSLEEPVVPRAAAGAIVVDVADADEADADEADADEADADEAAADEAAADEAAADEAAADEADEVDADEGDAEMAIAVEVKAEEEEDGEEVVGEAEGEEDGGGE